MVCTPSELVRCSSCHRDYEPVPFAVNCPDCGGASWVATSIAERDALVRRSLEEHVIAPRIIDAQVVPREADALEAVLFQHAL
jgi:hypothetical protein